jgi:hypothetical protein
MSVPIEAPESSPGHVGHTPQPWANLGLSLGRLHDLAGGVFGSAIVRAMLGQRESPGTLGAAPMQEYALQPFGIPGRQDARAKPPTPAQAAASTAHTILALEEASIKLGRSGRHDQTVPTELRNALDDYRTWKAPR